MYRKRFSASGVSINSTYILDASLNINSVDMCLYLNGVVEINGTAFWQTPLTTGYVTRLAMDNSGLLLSITHYTVTKYFVEIVYTKA